MRRGARPAHPAHGPAGRDPDDLRYLHAAGAAHAAAAAQPGRAAAHHGRPARYGGGLQCQREPTHRRRALPCAPVRAGGQSGRRVAQCPPVPRGGASGARRRARRGCAAGGAGTAGNRSAGGVGGAGGCPGAAAVCAVRGPAGLLAGARQAAENDAPAPGAGHVLHAGQRAGVRHAARGYSGAADGDGIRAEPHQQAGGPSAGGGCCHGPAGQVRAGAHRLR